MPQGAMEQALEMLGTSVSASELSALKLQMASRLRHLMTAEKEAVSTLDIATGRQDPRFAEIRDNLQFLHKVCARQSA